MSGLVGNRYQLERVLGRGRLSVVWWAYDLYHRRPVAVKVLTPAAAGDRAILQRLDREARAVAGMAHPNIVGMYDAGVDGADAYQVLELVDGPSLAAVLAEGPLPADQAVDIAKQICDALAAAHAAGVVHGDLSPDNVLLAPGGLVKVGGFGTAHLRGGGSPDPRADTYAAGWLLYAMLVGGPPPTGGQAVSAALRGYRPDVPAEIAALVGHLLAADPADRPASADEVARRLVAAVQDSVSPPTTEAHQPRHSQPAAQRRWQRPAVVASVALVTLLAVLTAYLMLGRGADPAAAPSEAPPQSGPTDAVSEPIETSEVSPSPSATSSTPRGRRTVDLIAALRARLPQLVRDGQLNAQSARELDRRLGEAAHQLAARQTDSARSTLRGAADRVVKLRDQNKITDAGYDLLKAAFTQIAESLSPP